jgi:hypothetical protein
MKHLTSLILRAVVALAMFGSTGELLASPVYHVSIDSRSLSGQGYLDFLFLGTAGSATADVKLTNFNGSFDKSVAVKSNADGSLDTGVTIRNNTGWNEFAQLANFGSLFAFDVQFNVAGNATGGTTLSIALLDAGLNGYAVGTTGDLATFDLYPGQPEIVSVSDRAVVGPAVVPEPAALAQMVSGLLLLLGTLGRRRR